MDMFWQGFEKRAYDSDWGYEDESTHYGIAANRGIRGTKPARAVQRALKDKDAQVTFVDHEGKSWDTNEHSREDMHKKLNDLHKSGLRFDWTIGMPKAKFQPAAGEKNKHSEPQTAHGKILDHIHKHFKP